MADKLAPAFQFYANDWLADINVTMMSPAQEGAYIRLLCYAWKDPDCSLPDDDDQLAILSRLGEGWFNGGSHLVRKCFNQVGGRLVHEGLTDIRKKHLEWSNKSKQGGIKSGEVRRLRASKGGSKMVEPNANLSSSSSSSSSNRNVGKPTLNPLTPFGEKLPYESASFCDAWLAWWNHREEIGKRLKHTSVTQQIKELAGMGESRATAALLFSVRNGYQGIFEEKTNGFKQQSFAVGAGQRYAG